MVELGRLDIISILSDATNVIAEGEVQQLANVGNRRHQRIGLLRGHSREDGDAVSGGFAYRGGTRERTNPRRSRRCASTALTLGLAYQLVDDWLDYAGDPAIMGKNAGDDLAEGKMTLPLIHTLSHGTSSDRRIVRDAIEPHGQAPHSSEVVLAVQRCGALDRTRHDAEVHAQRAIDLLKELPRGAHHDALADLARFCVARLN